MVFDARAKDENAKTVRKKMKTQRKQVSVNENTKTRRQKVLRGKIYIKHEKGRKVRNRRTQELCNASNKKSRNGRHNKRRGKKEADEQPKYQPDTAPQWD
jgi:hypothetical protein